MNLEEYTRMRELEEFSWWFRGRQAIVERLLEAHTPFGTPGANLTILDAGCGTGKILTDFTRRGHLVVGLDFSDRALDYTAARGAELLVRGDAQAMPLNNAAFDLVVALDTLEHVADDQAMVTEIFRVLRPGGFAIFNVPAHPRLWSEHDIALQHFRRYTPDSLRAVVASAGFSITRFTYSMAAVYPVAALVRLASPYRPHLDKPAQSHMRRHWGPLNAALSVVMRAESRLIRRVNMPIGLSLLTLVQRPEAAAAHDSSPHA